MDQVEGDCAPRMATINVELQGGPTDGALVQGDMPDGSVHLALLALQGELYPSLIGAAVHDATAPPRESKRL
eukprot:15469102-Alexandrium_andersonii.AAC.1